MKYKILLLHGFLSHGYLKAFRLRNLGYEVYCPKLSNWSFSKACRTAQEAFDEYNPDIVIGSSRGGAVAMNINTGNSKLILLAPAYNYWGKAKQIIKNVSIYHGLYDRKVRLIHSAILDSLSPNSRLIVVSDKHELNSKETFKKIKKELFNGYKPKKVKQKVQKAIRGEGYWVNN